ncbi:3-hydroxyacyl-CoA dehydrogenase family protein, partial [Paraburkholderia sp. SIMBA_049]
MESIYNQFYHEARYRPHPLTRQMLVGKKLGRKVGEGFYHYENGQKLSTATTQDKSSEALISDAVISSVWVGTDLAEDKNQLVDY